MTDCALETRERNHNGTVPHQFVSNILAIKIVGFRTHLGVSNHATVI